MVNPSTDLMPGMGRLMALTKCPLPDNKIKNMYIKTGSKKCPPIRKKRRKYVGYMYKGGPDVMIHGESSSKGL